MLTGRIQVLEVRISSRPWGDFRLAVGKFCKILLFRVARF